MASAISAELPATTGLDCGDAECQAAGGVGDDGADEAALLSTKARSISLPKIVPDGINTQDPLGPQLTVYGPPEIDPSAVYVPPEFGPNSYLWIGWPAFPYVENLRPPTEVVVEMITEICKCDFSKPGCTAVKIQVIPSGLDGAKRAIAQAKLPKSCPIYYSVQERDDIWIRDMGPVFTKIDCTGIRGCHPLGLVDFNFDYWGAPALGTDEFTRLEASLDTKIYESLNGTKILSHIIAEGGNREFNGKGTLLMNLDVEISRNIKYSWGKERSEEEYKRVFGVKKIVWITGVPTNDFLAEFPVKAYIDDQKQYAYNWGTGGHVDEIVRFVDASTVLVASVTLPEARLDPYKLVKKDMEVLDNIYDQLKQATDQDGKPFKVIKVPAAPVYIQELKPGDVAYDIWYSPLKSFQRTVEAGGKIHGIAATSYLNFVYTNQVVLVPKYYVAGDPIFGKDSIKKSDDDFKALMEKLFPTRRVAQVNPLTINIGGGGMHCITAHQYR